MKRAEIVERMKNHTVTFNFKNCDGDYRSKYGNVSMTTDVIEFVKFNPKDLLNTLLDLSKQQLISVKTENNEMLGEVTDRLHELYEAEDNFHGKYIDLPRLISETMEVIEWYEAHPTYIFSGI